MVDDDPEIERSPLSREFSLDGVTVNVEIYRLKGGDEGWSLEVVDHEWASTVWDDLFATDQEAYQAFRSTVEQEGIRTFLTPSPRLH